MTTSKASAMQTLEAWLTDNMVAYSKDQPFPNLYLITIKDPISGDASLPFFFDEQGNLQRGL